MSADDWTCCEPSKVSFWFEGSITVSNKMPEGQRKKVSKKGTL